MRSTAEIGVLYRQMRQAGAARDQRQQDVLSVRRGDMGDVFPDHFSDIYPKSIVANFVDVCARDLAEVIAPLPSFICASGRMVSEAAKKRASKRTKIVHNYALHSRLEQRMLSGADFYLTFAALPFRVEPDYDAHLPRVVIESPIGAYWRRDRKGNVSIYAKRWFKRVGDLAAEWPEYAEVIVGKDRFGQPNPPDHLIEMVRYEDADQTLLFLPERQNLVLGQMANTLGMCMVEVAERPGPEDDRPRGQFDDVLWVQLARHKIALLQLEAAEESVQAPWAVPDDVQELTFGPGAVMRSSTPEKIRRVATEISQGAFAESQLLDQELHMGARYPQGRQGVQNSSVITGRGVQELLGGFDTQIKTAQTIFRESLRRVIGFCFQMDEKLWPEESKTIRGDMKGAPFEETYTPSKDISGDVTVNVVYGFAAGMDPNRALVMLLQLRADKAIDRRMMLENLPLDIDFSQMDERVDVEALNDSLKTGIEQMLANLGALISQGQDPTNLLKQVATIITERSKGRPLDQVILEAFTPPAQPNDQTQQGGSPDGGAGPPQLGGDTPQQNPQQWLRPDAQRLLSGLTASGQPNVSATVMRQRLA